MMTRIEARRAAPGASAGPYRVRLKADKTAARVIVRGPVVAWCDAPNIETLPTELFGRHNKVGQGGSTQLDSRRYSAYHRLYWEGRPSFEAVPGQVAEEPGDTGPVVNRGLRIRHWRVLFLGRGAE
jgi:hypothetical protein